MDQLQDAIGLLDFLDRPAFCVCDGIIIKTNPAAAGLMIETGMQITDILQTGKEEYRDFTDGCLYLNLSVAEQKLGASVTRMQKFDIFRIEQDSDNRELQAMALAAQELRGPLSTVMITADRLFPIAGTDSDTGEGAARLNRGLLQMLRVIGNMSDAILYTTATNEHQDILDLSRMMAEIFEKSMALSSHTEISLEYEGYPEPVYSLVDPEKLERAVLNILSNAYKFTPAGGTIRAKLTRRGNMMYLSIHDSSSGIRDDVRGSIFSRYTRGAAIEDDRFGIGLGMVLIRSTAALHGGTVLIDQPEGTGVRVTMSLAIRSSGDTLLHSPIRRIDRSGGHDRTLVELSNVLPPALYSPVSDS